MTQQARDKRGRPHLAVADPDEAAASDEDLVTCIMSGRRVPRSAAVEVRLGSRRKVWMLPEFCREREPRDT